MHILFKSDYSATYEVKIIMKNNIDVVAAEIAPEVIGDYLKDMGLERQDHVFIKKVKNHIKIGRVAFRCIE
ncbi:hypothetical protein MBGDF03_01154 [Thermoplasmatales archaeon SCGC AB-540-F20]|nr:hypothetical protein MBGDF03_01154 [Thermoplasmatales archaeon SCGC AB-540-F20]